MHSPCGQMGISPLKLLRRVRHREVKLLFTGQVLMAPLVALRILGSVTPVGVPLRVIMWHLQVRWARILSSSSASRWKQWRRPPRRVPELLLPLPVDSQNLDIVLVTIPTHAYHTRTEPTFSYSNPWCHTDIIMTSSPLMTSFYSTTTSSLEHYKYSSIP